MKKFSYLMRGYTMPSRRKFIKNTILASAATAIGSKSLMSNTINKKAFHSKTSVQKPVVISTWDIGVKANAKAWEILTGNGRALDAVEQGVRIPEADPNITTIGYGGLPDRDGYVTLDACIMDEKGNAGSVAFLQYIMHPISVARVVMEKTPHVMIVGEGALKVALDNGFKKQNLLTDEAKKEWELWLKNHNYKPYKYDKDNHDTIGMLALDNNGNLSGACTTSGVKFKYHGRVADSAIIGAGLFVDNEVGGAAATGLGESVIKIAGSHLVVEMMRMGKSPDEACEIAVRRIIEKQQGYKDFQVAFIALNKNGETGSYAIHKDFQYVVTSKERNKLIDTKFYMD
jgi:N4-(beta-N-acetylglucosaminyl)-L-asparaginase